MCENPREVIGSGLVSWLDETTTDYTYRYGCILHLRDGSMVTLDCGWNMDGAVALAKAAGCTTTVKLDLV